MPGNGNGIYGAFLVQQLLGPHKAPLIGCVSRRLSTRWGGGPWSGRRSAADGRTEWILSCSCIYFAGTAFAKRRQQQQQQYRRVAAAMHASSCLDCFAASSSSSSYVQRVKVTAVYCGSREKRGREDWNRKDFRQKQFQR